MRKVEIKIEGVFTERLKYNLFLRYENVTYLDIQFILVNCKNNRFARRFHCEFSQFS